MQIDNSKLPLLKNLEVCYDVDASGSVTVEKVEAFIEYAWQFADVTELFRHDLRAMQRLERDIQAWHDEHYELTQVEARGDDECDKARDRECELEAGA